jgi:hypothetical protein
MLNEKKELKIINEYREQKKKKKKYAENGSETTQ